MSKLVLTAKTGDVIYIGNDVKATFDLQRHSNQVRITFDAPPEIAIDREKIRLQKIANGEMK